MVDKLRKAAEDLEAPCCSACHIDMKWFRSELVRSAPVSIIVHQFVCPACEGIEQRETKSTPVRVPPDKLALPDNIAGPLGARLSVVFG